MWGAASMFFVSINCVCYGETLHIRERCWFAAFKKKELLSSSAKCQ